MLADGILVVYDLEFTSWQGFMESGWSLPGKQREIVQVGALRLDAGAGFAERDAFQAMVRPAHHPRLSDYFVDLTGITQDRVEAEGRPFPDVLADFRDFAAGADAFGAFGLDAEVVAENCVLWDQPVPDLAKRTVNLRPAILPCLDSGERHVCSGELPELLGLPPVGRGHDALDDCRAIAAALQELRRRQAL